MRRPEPEQVRQLLRVLMDRGDISRPALVASLQRETGCSRATGYRAVTDAIKAGLIGFEESGGETEMA